MKIDRLNVKVTFTQPLLGTASGNPELHDEFVTSRVAEFRGDRSLLEQEKLKAEEVAAVATEEVQKAKTVFQHDETGLFMFDYQWRGFFKEGVSHMIELGQTTKLNPWNYKRACDGCLFVNPRRVYLKTPAGEFIEHAEKNNQRPLRAETQQGPRIALANSDELPIGSTMEFEVEILVSENPKSAWKEVTLDLVREILNHGVRKGTGQWRSGGWGRFTWEEAKA
jgi:hypothetical protein